MEKTLQRNENCAAMAGIESVYYLDIKNLTSITPNNDGVSVMIATGHSWSEIEHDGITAGVVSEGGNAYRHTVQVIYHGNAQEVTRDLDEMRHRRLLMKVVDSNGISWLYGNTDSPLRMRYQSDNDGEADGTTSYTLQFSALCTTPEMRIY